MTTNPIVPSGLSITQNIFALTKLDFDPNSDNDTIGTYALAVHWLRENGFHIVASWDPETINWINYNSHNWHWVRDPSTPYQSPERMRVCKDCGIEDMGHPDEFDIEYPNCEEVGKDK